MGRLLRLALERKKQTQMLQCFVGMRAGYLYELAQMDTLQSLKSGLEKAEKYAEFALAERDCPMECRSLLRRVHQAETDLREQTTCHNTELEAQRSFHKASVSKLAAFSKYCDEQEKRRQQALKVVSNASKQCQVMPVSR